MIDKIPVIDCRKVRVHTMNRERPENGEIIAYYFTQTNSWHIGTFYEDGYGSVSHVSGFNSVNPHVPYWVRLPKIHDDASCLETDAEGEKK